MRHVECYLALKKLEYHGALFVVLNHLFIQGCHLKYFNNWYSTGTDQSESRPAISNQHRALKPQPSSWFTLLCPL